MPRSASAVAQQRAIAKRAGVGKATIYRWWASKAAVAMDAIQDGIDPQIPFPDTAPPARTFVGRSLP